MKQKLLVTMLIVILVPQLCKAQVYDEEKRLQWRSMETGPLEFEPKFYYWLFHNNYAHHEWEWEWHGLFHSGFYLNLKPHKSDAKPLLPKRTLGAATDEWARNPPTHKRRISSTSWSRRHWLQQTEGLMEPICSSRKILTRCSRRFPQV